MSGMALIGVETYPDAVVAAAGGGVLFDSTFEKGTAGPAGPFTFASNLGTVAGSVGSNSNRVIIIGAAFDTAGVSGVTASWNAVSATAIGSPVSTPTGGRSIYLFGLIAPDTGSNLLLVNWSGGSGVVLGAGSFYNANQSTAWQNFNSSTGTSTAPSLNVTSSSTSMIFAVFADNNSNSFTITSPGVKDWEDRNFDGNYEAGHQVASGSSPTTIAATLGNSQAWAMAGVEIVIP